MTLTARLSQGNGSNVFWGVVSDGSPIEGRRGTYEGNVHTSVNTIVFDGPACRGFSLMR